MRVDELYSASQLISDRIDRDDHADSPLGERIGNTRPEGLFIEVNRHLVSSRSDVIREGNSCSLGIEIIEFVVAHLPQTARIREHLTDNAPPNIRVSLELALHDRNRPDS
jgi:hypothetical protein